MRWGINLHALIAIFGTLAGIGLLATIFLSVARAESINRNQHSEADLYSRRSRQVVKLSAVALAILILSSVFAPSSCDKPDDSCKSSPSVETVKD